MQELVAIFACWMGTTRGVLSYILVTIPGEGILHARAYLFFFGAFQLAFLYRICTTSIAFQSKSRARTNKTE